MRWSDFHDAPSSAARANALPPETDETSSPDSAAANVHAVEARFDIHPATGRGNRRTCPIIS